MARFEKDPGRGGNLINGASTDQQETLPQVFTTKTTKRPKLRSKRGDAATPKGNFRPKLEKGTSSSLPPALNG
jgi:hypothetical protein